MNKQGERGIGWCDYTWNPVTGCKSTKEQCAVADVCYARRLSKRIGQPFYPRFHPKRLEQPYKLKKPSRIFVCSMGELFGPWVPRKWQEAVLNVVEENPHHTFQFLTKHPVGYELLSFPPNAWLGVTITSYMDRHRWVEFLSATTGKENVCFASFEPLLGPVYEFGPHVLDWIIVGAQTNPEKQPEGIWVDYLVECAEGLQIPLFMKSNLDYEPKRREWPSGG